MTMDECYEMMMGYFRSREPEATLKFFLKEAGTDLALAIR